MNLVRNCFLFITAAPYIAFGVLILTFVLPMKATWRAKVLWTLGLAVCCVKFTAFKWFGGSNFYPELPEKLVWLWNWAYSGVMFLTLLSVLTFFWRNPVKRWILPLVAWTLSAIGLWSGVKTPDVTAREFWFENLPPALDGYRIAHVSDVHCSCAARRWRTESLVARVNALKPDLICMTGDYVDGRLALYRDDFKPIVNLKARDGVWWITGNHEYYDDHVRWRAFYREMGFRFLTNDCVRPRAGLTLAGVNDRRVRDRRGKVYGLEPNVVAAFAKAPPNDFRILLEHDPAYARVNASRVRFDLQLSGHTHGGIMPILKQIVARANRGFVSGVYDLGEGRKLCVSNGSGQWAGFPMRFFASSEIILITLRKGHAK